MRVPSRERRPTCSASDGRTDPRHLERVGEGVRSARVLGQALGEDGDDDGVTAGRTLAHGARQLGRSGRRDETRDAADDHRVGARRSVVKAGPRQREDGAGCLGTCGRNRRSGTISLMLL